MKHAALVAALAVLAAASQEKAGVYAFPKDEIQRYEVVGTLQISLKGSHVALVKDGHEMPLKVQYNALFENVVLRPGSATDVATIERRVKWLKVNGEYMGEKLKIDYDAGRPEATRFKSEEGEANLVDFFRSWVTRPLQVTVNEVGQVKLSDSALDRMVIKAGLMYRPIKPDAAKWVTPEKLAVPIFHHKIKIDFHMSPVKTVLRGGRKFMEMAGEAKFAGSEPPPAEIPAEFPADLEFKATGLAEAELDLTNGRMSKLSTDVRVTITGEAPVPGGKGDLKGEVTFLETQTLK